MRKEIKPCQCSYDGNLLDVSLNLEYEDGTLYISGLIGPYPSNNTPISVYKGATPDVVRKGIPAENWTKEMLLKLCEIWEKWNNNNMRPYCLHMKELGWVEESHQKVMVKIWHLKKEAAVKKEKAKNRAAECSRNKKTFIPTEEEALYMDLDNSCVTYGDEEITKNIRYSLYLCRTAYEEYYHTKENVTLGRLKEWILERCSREEKNR